MRRALLVAALAFGGVGCGGGDDGDGSKSCSSADADQDYLSECEERALGTDPKVADSDGDGYLDGDEVLEDKDPLDAASRIYKGGWPYTRKKAELADPGFGGQAAAGALVPRLVALDQYGEKVDLYDFAFQGKPVVIDLSALWCDACKEMATWLEKKPSSMDAQPELAPIVDRVAAGEILWVTVLFEDGLGNPAKPEHVVTWAESYPNPRVAVLLDDNRSLRDWFYPGAMPSVHALDEKLALVIYERFDYKKPLGKLLE